MKKKKKKPTSFRVLLLDLMHACVMLFFYYYLILHMILKQHGFDIVHCGFGAMSAHVRIVFSMINHY